VPDHPPETDRGQLAHVQHAVAARRSAARSEEYAEAEPLLVKGYEGMKTREQTIPKTGGGELRIPQALDRLIELYTAINKPDEAKKWQTERAKYPETKKADAPEKKG
jgi:hypothetical protein